MQTRNTNVLTPREREAFDLLRRGFTNEEIAATMGISADGAKYHVSQILSKLGVATREEAAALSIEAARASRAWLGLALGWKLAGVAVVAVAGVGIGVLTWAAVQNSDGESEADSSAVGPVVGDHWHATYGVVIGTELQPNFSAPDEGEGFSTPGDGIIHVHPRTSDQEGSAASLANFFNRVGAALGDGEIFLPAYGELRDGDPAPGDGMPGTLRITVVSTDDGPPREIHADYVPQDGDRIIISFRSDEQVVVLGDRTIIPVDEATHSLAIAVRDDAALGTTRFEPDRITVAAGETVAVTLVNEGAESHSIRVAGDDGKFYTSDDYVSEPEIIPPGAQGVVVLRLDVPGEALWEDATSLPVGGTIVVE